MVNFRDSYFQVDWDLTAKRLKGTYWGKQYDTGRGFAVTVINGGQVVTPTTEVLRLKWEKPDGTAGYVNATIVNGKFIVENIDQMFTVHGSVRADFELSVAGEFVASITFYVNVEKAVAVDAVASSSQFTALQDAVGSVDSLQQQFNNVVANVTVDSEVIAARGAEATLGERLDSTDVYLAEISIKSKNLFNKLTVTPGKYISYTNGVLEPLVNYNVSDFMPVIANTQYIRVQNSHIVFYDINKQYISGLAAATTFTTPANCAYVRISVHSTLLDTEQVELGNVKTEYESHYAKINKLIIPEKIIEKSMLNFLPVEGTKSKNLFDKATVTTGKYINYLNGALEPLVNYNASDFIPIGENLSGIRVQNSHMAFYDANKIYISGMAAATTFTTPTNCAYMRISVHDTLLDTEQVELGSVNTIYEPYGEKVPINALPSKISALIDNKEFMFQIPSDIYLIKGERFSVYYNNILKYSQKFRRGLYNIAWKKVVATTNVMTPYSYKWEVYPSVVGDFQIEFMIYDTYTNTKVASKIVTFHVADNTLTGKTANIVTMGDSFWSHGRIVERIYDFVTTKNGTNTINMIGTRATDYGNAKTDAIPGWEYGLYNNVASLGGNTNPFWNPALSKFDFSYYMAQNYPSYAPFGQAGEHVDAFISNSGINDIAYVNSTIATRLTQINKVIDSVHAYDPAIKIILGLITPQPIDDRYLVTDTLRINYEKNKYEQEKWNEMILGLHSPVNNVYVIPVNAHFDTRTGINTTTYYPDKFDLTYTEKQSLDIHPNLTGGKYIADTMYQFIYNKVLR